VKAFELSATITSDGNLAVPDSVRRLLPPGRAARVIVLIPDADEDEAWDRLAAEEFLSGYAAADAAYDRA
jgi:hypothetical protein